jgi:hypothetical protein
MHIMLLFFVYISYIHLFECAGMVDLKDLRPAFLRLLPEYQKVGPELVKLRQSLQKEVRDMVQKYGPTLGAVYSDSSLQWEQAMKRAVTANTGAESADTAATTNDSAANDSQERSVSVEERPIDTSVALMEVEEAMEGVVPGTEQTSASSTGSSASNKED